MKTITFFSTVPGLAETLPIIPAKDVSINWMQRAREDYISSLKTAKGKNNHIYQCPGIFDLFNQGFIVRMWHDVIITTNGDEKNYEFVVPSADLQELTNGKTLIGKQETGVGSLMPLRPWACQSLLKINTPWNIIAPKNLKFLIIPIAYPDNFEFESSIGILDPSISSEVNLQMYWNIKRGEYLLKAGTPLAHVIPLSSENYKLECRDANAYDKIWIEKKKFFNAFTFKLRRNLIKDAYLKHFGN